MAYPLVIEILLFYHCTGGQDFEMGGAAAKEYKINLTDIGMLKRTTNNAPGSYYEITEKGRYYVAHLCAVPFPITFYKIEEVVSVP